MEIADSRLSIWCFMILISLRFILSRVDIFYCPFSLEAYFTFWLRVFNSFSIMVVSSLKLVPGCSLSLRLIPKELYIQIYSMRARGMLALSAAIIAQIYYIVRGYVLKRKKMSLINRIDGLRVFSPRELTEKLVQTKGKWEALCAGKIYAGEKCRSVLNPNIGVVCSGLYEGDFATASKRRLIRVTEPSFMELRSNQGGIRIFQGHQAKIMPTKILKIRGRSLLDKAKEMLKNIFGTIPVSDQLSHGDFHSWDKVFELCLPEGSECTVLGNFQRQGKQLVCNRPKMIFPDKKRMISFVEDSIRSMQKVNVLLSITLGICLFILLKEVYMLVKQYSSSSKGEGSFSRIKNIFVKSRVCAMCKKNMSCVYNSKCRHMVVCQECFVKPAAACLECSQKQADYVQMFVC